MRLEHAQDAPGAEHGEAWTTTVTFEANEGMLEELFFCVFDGSELQAFPDEPARYTLLGRWERQEVIDFAIGKRAVARTERAPFQSVLVNGKYL